MKYTKDFTSYERYNCREDDELPFTASSTYLEYDDKPVPLEYLYKNDRLQETTTPIKKFKIKFVWTYKEGLRTWQEHEINIAAKSVKQAHYKFHEKLRQKENIYYKITSTWEISFFQGNPKIIDLRKINA